MDAERWRRIQEILDQIHELGAENRDERIDELCPDDPGLAQEIRSLLTQSRDDSFLERPAAQWTVSGELDRQSENIGENLDGRTFGGYRITREIGSGGMGVVYEAEQLEPVQRRVALKVIKAGMDTDQVLARFETERQALALMNHPTIARVFDAGSTPAGRPFFSMEFVVGEPITYFCDRHRLTVSDRLELFTRLCSGIHHAHQKGIIHRDIKPSNVLVSVEDGEPVPKIIDFGVAKATKSSVLENPDLTQLGQLIGTPAYMSPEQARLTEPDIDTRSDVYSLGALLFELLVGVPPIQSSDAARAAFDEVLRMIREQDRPTPTDRLSTLGGEAATELAVARQTNTGSLTREIRGDLDWIVTKALSRDREDRYPAASDLAADISRHLQHEPVAAGPPTTTYRLRKFVRRHRRAAITIGLVAATLILGIIGTTTGMVMAVRAMERAHREASTTRAVNQFMQEVLGSANPETGVGKHVTVLEALDRGLAKVEDHFKDDPEIEAAVRNSIGNTYRIIGRYDDAENQLNTALEIRRRELGPVHDDVAANLSDLGLMYQERGDPDGAEKLYRQSLEMYREIHGNMHPDVGMSLNNLAGALMQAGRHDEAEPLLREMVAMIRKGLGENNPIFAIGLNSLGGAVEGQGRYDEAEDLFRQSLDIVRDNFPSDHPGIAYSSDSLGAVLRLKGDCEQAESYYLTAIEVFRTALGPGHWREGASRSGYGACLTALGRFSDAEEQLVRAHEILVERVGEEDPATRVTQKRLAELYDAWGQPNRATNDR
jgi:serine/threonine protein kinase/Flp pilus assembly protein TadD